MSKGLYAVEDWLNENQAGLIICPYQPGGLLISKSACIKRHLSPEPEKIHRQKDEVFEFTLKKGLSLCHTCPIGKGLVASKSAG